MGLLDNRVIKHCRAYKCQKAWACEPNSNSNNFNGNRKAFYKMHGRYPMKCSCGKSGCDII